MDLGGQVFVEDCTWTLGTQHLFRFEFFPARHHLPPTFLRVSVVCLCISCADGCELHVFLCKLNKVLLRFGNMNFLHDFPRLAVAVVV